jgi:hypothetical protein
VCASAAQNVLLVLLLVVLLLLLLLLEQWVTTETPSVARLTPSTLFVRQAYNEYSVGTELENIDMKNW